MKILKYKEGLLISITITLLLTSYGVRAENTTVSESKSHLGKSDLFHKAKEYSTNKADITWRNQPIRTQKEDAQYTFVATPQGNKIDAVIGFSDGKASAYTDLAMIVRFAPTGNIDVRNGGRYVANKKVPYTANTKYTFTFEMNRSDHTYRVFVQPSNGNKVLLLDKSSFRTEQQSIDKINNTAHYGPVNVGAIVVKETPSVNPAPFKIWHNKAVTTQDSLAIYTFVAAPKGNKIDAVIGFSDGKANTYTDLAMIVRFAQSGNIDVRNGSTYTASKRVPYTAKNKYTFTLEMNRNNQTYRVFVKPSNGNKVLLLDKSSFRTEQQSVTKINNVAHFGPVKVGAVAVEKIEIEIPEKIETPEPNYTYRIPTTAELVVGGHNKLSALNIGAWKSTGGRPVEYAYHGTGTDQYSLSINKRADKSQIYQEIPTKPGRVYTVNAVSFKPDVNSNTFYSGADVYFSVESNIPSAEKANVLGESSSTAKYGYTEHTFEFTATGETAYIVGRSDQQNLAIHVSSVSVKEKDAVVPFKIISEIKHKGVTLPFSTLKQWRSKQTGKIYSEFSSDNNKSINKNPDSFVAGSSRFPTKRTLDRKNDRGIVNLWVNESKGATYWAVRGFVEKNPKHFDMAVKSIDKWAKVFGGIAGHGKGVEVSWHVKEYANAIEILLHNDIGYEYPAAEKARAEQFMDTIYSTMQGEKFELGRLGGNWVSSQLMAKLSYWIVKDSFATTNEARKIATDKFNFISRSIDSLFVSQIYLNSDPLGVPNTFYANGLDDIDGRMPVSRIHGGNLDNLDGIWYIGEGSSCFQHDGLVEEYYRDMGHAHMGMEPLLNMAQILYLQDGENLFERHKERLIKGSEVLQGAHLAALNIINPATGTPYTYLPKPECNSNVEVRFVEYKDRDIPNYAELHQKLSEQGALYSSQLYGYAKAHWSDWKDLLPKTHATLVTESKIAPWETGVPAVYLEAMFLRD